MAEADGEDEAEDPAPCKGELHSVPDLGEVVIDDYTRTEYAKGRNRPITEQGRLPSRELDATMNRPPIRSNAGQEARVKLQGLPDGDGVMVLEK